MLEFKCLKCGLVQFEGTALPYTCTGCGGLVLRQLACLTCGEEAYFRVDKRTCTKCGRYSDEGGYPGVVNVWLLLLVGFGVLGLIALALVGLTIWMRRMPL